MITPDWASIDTASSYVISRQRVTTTLTKRADDLYDRGVRSVQGVIIELNLDHIVFVSGRALYLAETPGY